MTATAINRPQFGYYNNPGESWEAKILNKLSRSIQDHLSNNAGSVEKSVKLEGAYREASTPDWDGHGAMVANLHSYHRAKEFLNMLPDSIPAPEFSVDPDGEISFDWFYSKFRLISISIGDDGSLTYIGFLGNVLMKGVEYLDEKIPESINELFTRIIR